MKYLITGGNGQLGSAFSTYINKECKGSVAFNAACNINDTESLSKIIDNTYDAIVNFAGIASVQNCDNSPIDCYETNTISVEKTLEVLKNINYGGKYINIGSINEFLPNKSEQTYAKTKIRAREIISKFRDDGLKCYQYTIGVCLSDRKTKNIGALVSNIYKLSSIVKDLNNDGLCAEPLSLYNIDSPVRFSSCESMAKAIDKTCRNEISNPDLYIDSETTTLRDVIKEVMKFSKLGYGEDKESGDFYVQTSPGLLTKIIASSKIDLPNFTKSPDLEIPASYQSIIPRITEAVLNDKLALN